MTTSGNQAPGRAGVRAVCFDAFGTVVEIGDKRRPFRTLLRERPEGDLATVVLTQPMDIRAVAKLLATDLDENRLVQLEQDLQAEIASIQLRDGIGEIWKRLKGEGIKIGICSNLAMPYG